MGDLKRKRGRKPKNVVAEANAAASASTSTAVDDGAVVAVPTEATKQDSQTHRRGRGRPKKGGNHSEDDRSDMAASPERRAPRLYDHNGAGDSIAHNGHVIVEAVAAPPQVRWESVAAAAKAASSMDAVVKVFCVHTEPNFSLPWQRKRQYSSSSSGFIIGGRRILTNAHSVEHHTQVKLKKRGSDTKYLATVLAIGTECDIGMNF